MSRSFVSFVLAVVVADSALAGINVVNSIELSRDKRLPKAAMVRITCSEAPIFQVYEAHNPRRVVVEMLATELAGHLGRDLALVPPVTQVDLERGQGPVGQVARLHFAVDAGTVYDVRTDRNVIEIEVFEDGESDEIEQARRREQLARREQETRRLIEARKKAEAEKLASERRRQQAEADRARLAIEKAQAVAAAQAAEQARQREAERRRQEEARRLAEEQRRLEAEREAEQRALEARRQAEAEKQRLAAEAKKRRQEELRRRQAEQEARRLAEAKARAEEKARRAAEEKKRAAQLAEQERAAKQRLQREKDRAAEQARQAEIERRRLKQALAAAEAEKQRLAQQARALEAEKQRLQQQAQAKAETQTGPAGDSTSPAPRGDPRASHVSFGGPSKRAPSQGRIAHPSTPLPRGQAAFGGPSSQNQGGPVAQKVVVAAAPPSPRAVPLATSHRPARLVAPGLFTRIDLGPGMAGALDDEGEAVSPREVTRIRYRVIGSESQLSLTVSGGARYSLRRVGRQRVELVLWDCVIYNLGYLRALDLRASGGSLLYMSPSVEGTLRSRVVLEIEHRPGAQIYVRSSGEILTLIAR